MPRITLVFLPLLVLMAACDQKNNKPTTNSGMAAREVEPYYLITRTGDTIPISVPIPAKGKRIDPNSVTKPRVTPLRGQPKVVPAHTNVYPAGTPRIIPVPEELSVITPGRDGVPLPNKMFAKGKIVPVIQPRSLPALSLRMKDGASYNIQYLDVDQGINSSNVNSMLEDSRGHLWFGTIYGGVSRYDGQSFTHYTTKEGLSDNSVLSILEDSRGNLWFGTNRGVYRYDGHRFTHFIMKEILIHNRVSSILEDSRGNLWFGTIGGGVSRYDGQSFTHYTYREGLSNNWVNSILEDSRGNLWFGTNGGVSRYDGQSFTHYTTKEGLSDNSVLSILEDSKGHLWFGTGYGGVSRYDGQSFTQYTTKEGLSDNTVRSILEDSKGHLWFGTGYDGVSRYDGQSFTHYTTKEGLSDNSVLSILEDSKGNLWFGTGGGGVSRYDRKSFSHFTPEQGLSDNTVRSVLEDSRGNLWFGTHSGVSRYDGQNFTHYTTKEGLSNDWVISILEDSRSNLWFGTPSGVNRYDPDAFSGQGSFTHYTTKEGLSDNWVESIMEDSQGNLWFGTGGGVSKYDGRSFTHFTTEEGLSNNWIRYMLEDCQGNLWIGTNVGMSRYDGQSITYYYLTKKDLSGNWVRSMLEDSQGHLWICTDGGLNHYDGQGFTHYTIEKGLSDDYVRSILEDSQGNFWISTRKGITLFIPLVTKESAISDLEKAEYQILTFVKADGLKRLEYAPKSVCLDSRNRIWWGSKDGLTMLDLNKYQFPSESPKHMNLTYIEVEQQFVDYRRLADTTYRNQFSFGKALSLAFDSVAPFYNYPIKMTLPNDLNHLTFHFSAIDWVAPHKIQYSYFLEGLDKDWSLSQSEPKADYRNLPHGTYTLKVKVIGAGQVWGDPFEYTFTILPPWYRTWWAYVLWATLILGITYWFYRFQLNRQLTLAEAQQIKELDRVKTRMYTNITHEFRTPLTIILGMTKQMKSDPQNWYNEGLRLIRRNGKQLLNLVNQMLDLSKLESGHMPLKLINGDLISFLQYITESFHSYADSKDIRLHFFSGQDELYLDYDPEKLQNVVSNLLSNAIKFTPAGGNVYVSIWSTEEAIQLQIKDNGIGIEPEHLPFIFDRFYQADVSNTRRGEGTGIGLALVKELVNVMGGSIQVESSKEKGTKLTIQLPVTQKATKVQPENGLEISQSLGDTLLLDVEKKSEISEISKGDRHLVLLVEDNEDVLTYLASFLSGNYQIVTATDGQMGIDKALQLIPDLIVSDVMMPEKDGYEVCATLKANERTSHIPIILLTAKSDQTAKIEGLAVGADAYLAKPFNQEELLVRIERLIELRQQMQKRFQQSGALSQTLKPSIKTKEEVFLQKVLEIIDKNMKDENFGMPQLCKELHMSRSHLFRKLKAVTGKSATHLIRALRLEKAKELLESGRMNVTEVCFEVGFNNPGYFSMVFHEEFGVSPSTFRKDYPD